jgi:hypothetical protein
MSTPINVGKGITMETTEDGKTLIVKIDLTQDHGPSSSGKTRIVASTNGNQRVPGNDAIQIGINAFKK